MELSGSDADYDLTGADRMVLRAEDLTDGQMEAIRYAEVAGEASEFDHEVDDCFGFSGHR